MFPTVRILGHVERTYWVLHLAGIAVGLVLGWRELRRIGLSAGRTVATLAGLVVAAHLGAHAYHVLTNPEHYWLGRGDWRDFATQGLSLHGGILGAYLGLLVVARWLAVSSWRLADALAPSGAVALGVFRLGCWAEGCCYGRRLPAGSWLEGVSTKLIGNADVSLHPTQLYCAGFALALFAWMWHRRVRKRFDGELVVVGMLLYPVWRFGVEFVRADTAKNHPFLGVGLSSNQLVAAGLFALGLAFAWHHRAELRAR